MAYPVIMPKTGMAMEEGTILRWLKKEGEPVAKGEILLEIETDKTSMEVESEADGRLLAILRKEGEVVPVTQTIAWIGQPGEVLSEGAPTPAAVAPAAPAPAAAGVGEAARAELAPAAAPPPGKVPATPAAKRRAAELGLPPATLAGVRGTGPFGAVRLRDLETAGVRPDAGPAAPGEGQPLTGLRRTIADKMVRSWQVPSPTLITRADVTELAETRRTLNASGEVKISVTDLVVKAVAAVLREHPLLNSSFEDGRVVQHEEVDVGVAVALEDGLVVPVLHRADTLSLRQIAEATRELAALARERRLTREQVSGGTFTVSSLGMYGVTAFTPLLNVPECAILGVGAVEEVLRFDERRQVVGRQVLELCLTHDHRLVDGAPAALFLQSVRRLLENPLALLM
ncbi:MAG: dihydrolipoamide acetyltransferase family protein [Spirochaetia bacterium]|jgi:pyruvate dehydrogenase E2 component (dihydrolipoamide acetyltransferase)